MCVTLKESKRVKECGLEMKPKVVLYNEDHYETAYQANEFIAF
jgi:NAD-dependent SIR2 family protein deacetylase